MPRKKWLLTFSVIFVFILFTGFGCKGLTAREQSALAPINLEYWTVFDDVDAIRAAIQEFRATHPHINVYVRQLRQDEFYNRLIEAMSEDKGPDIISVHNRSLQEYLGKLSPLPASVRDTTSYIKKSQLGDEIVVNTVNLPMITLTQLGNEYVQAVKGDVVVNGKIYGLPLSLDTMGVYYNKDLLDRAGVAEPPKTWEEFQAAVKKITKYDRKTGKVDQSGAALGTGNNIPGVDDLLFMLFKQSNVPFVSKSGQPLFNNVPNNTGGESPAMNVMNFYTDFANSSRDTYTWDESFDNALDRFVNGSVAFFFGYSYHYQVIKARAPQLNLGVLPMLQLNPDKPINVASYWLQSVVNKSKHPDEAWDVVDFLAHSKATKAYLDITGRPTALRAYITAQQEKLELQPFVSQVLIAENWYKGRNYGAAVGALKDLVHNWLLPAPNSDQFLQYRQQLLNNAAAKVNQTL